MDRTPNTATLEVEAWHTYLTLVDGDGRPNRFDVIPDGPFLQKVTSAEFQAAADMILAGRGYRRRGAWEGAAWTWTALVALAAAPCEGGQEASTTSARPLLERAIDDSADALYAQLRDRGFRREDHSPRVLQGEMVMVAVNADGYRLTFPGEGEPMGLAIVDLPLTVSYATVVTVATCIEGDCRWTAENNATA